MQISKKKFYFSLVLLGLIGQVAWVVENMYLNVFIYKMFSASASDISLMVALSALAAALTTLFIGALSDRVGRLKLIMGLGYITWGVTILLFGLVRLDLIEPIAGSRAEACAIGVMLVIILDTVMTFFGSSANDAAFNAWLTEMGDGGDRGRIEGINAMMPLVAILAVFGGFMGFDLDRSESWTAIFTIIGVLVIIVGFLCFITVEEPKRKKVTRDGYLSTLVYSFRPSVVVKNKLLYLILAAFALFGISIQTFMPYLIIYYEKTLGMSDYVLIMAPAIIIASAVTVLYGRLYDMLGFKTSVYPTVFMLISGYAILYLTVSKVPVFIGSLLMMCGYLSGMAVFGAAIRDRIPESMAGRFQGVRIIGGVLLPGVIGPAIGAFVLRDAEEILGDDGTYSFLPNKNIWLAAILTAVAVLLFLAFLFGFIRNATEYHPTEAAQNGRISKWERHPRPQLRRRKYKVLTDGWMLNGERINVPYPPESVLSGYKGKVKNPLVYEKIFTLPEDFGRGRTLLHFGAVDQVCTVLLNGREVGRHEDGYIDFTLDITDYVNNGENELRVICRDTLDRRYPYGKQTKKRGGMWYTPISGIWQSVWLESVPEKYIERIRMTPDLKGVRLELFGDISSFTVELFGREYRSEGREMYLEPEEIHLWTPNDPYLYEIKLCAGEDEVFTYFALRTVEIKENELLLNGKPLFLHGVLDQGYYPDGIFLPAEEEEYERDILRMKALGFNTLRKHIKVEPECFYYYCDRLGMLVLQDMVNSGPYSFLLDTALPTVGMKRSIPKTAGKKRRDIFERHMEGVVERLGNHPSIVMYTLFNEGWGQFGTEKMLQKLKSLDPSRPVDAASGWFKTDANDFESEHIYFKTVSLPESAKPMLLSECGGYTRQIEGHLFSTYASYGYGGESDESSLTSRIEEMYEKMVIPSNSVGCIYTQLSDVEDEINGLYTYDRKVCKVNGERMKALSERIYRKTEKDT